MQATLALLGWDRETLMVSALAGLVVAGVIVSIGAWWLLIRERRASRRRP